MNSRWKRKLEDQQAVNNSDQDAAWMKLVKFIRPTLGKRQNIKLVRITISWKRVLEERLFHADMISDISIPWIRPQW